MREAELSIERRLGAQELSIVCVQSNLAATYHVLGNFEQAMRMSRDIYSVRLKLLGEEHYQTIAAALNYAGTLGDLKRFQEAKSLMRKTIPVARRVIGDSADLTLKMRWIYAQSLYRADGATLDDLREAVTTLEEAARIARRVFGGAHPTTTGIDTCLRESRVALHLLLAWNHILSYLSPARLAACRQVSHRLRRLVVEAAIGGS